MNSSSASWTADSRETGEGLLMMLRTLPAGPERDNATPTEAELQAAASLNQDELNALNEQMVSENLTALRAMDVVTVDPNLPPMFARATPDALGWGLYAEELFWEGGGYGDSEPS